jgi:hypothetical protein
LPRLYPFRAQHENHTQADDEEGPFITVEYVSSAVDSPVASAKRTIVEAVASPDRLDEEIANRRRRADEVTYISYIRRNSKESDSFLLLSVASQEGRVTCYEGLSLSDGATKTFCVLPRSHGEERADFSMLHLGAVYFVGFDDVDIVESKDFALSLEFNHFE